MARRSKQIVFMSATPGPFEREHSTKVVEQIVRPTGLMDPEVVVRPTKGQIDDLLGEIRDRAFERSGSSYDPDQEDGRGPHRLPARDGGQGPISALRDRHLRDGPVAARSATGEYDVLVGINLLRKGSTCPRCRWSRSSTPTRKASFGPRPRSSRSSAAQPETSPARS